MRLLHGSLKQSAKELRALSGRRIAGERKPGPGAEGRAGKAEYLQPDGGCAAGEDTAADAEAGGMTFAERARNRLAMFVAAMAVVLPPLLLAGGLMVLLLWLFTHGF